VLLDKINTTTGIPEENIFVHSSQTHNAPGVDGRVMSPESEQWLAGRIASLVKSAADSRRPATLRVGRAPVQVGYNRRLMKDGQVVMAPNPEGAVVPWVDVLNVCGEDGKRIAVLFLHAAHPVIVHWSSEATGPDFPGYAVYHLHNLLSGKGEDEGVFMFAQGCCGNINGYPLRGGIAASDAAGLSLAFAVTCALEEDRGIAAGPLKVRSDTLYLPLQDPPTVSECRELLAGEPDNQRYQALLEMAESGEPRFMPLYMRALAIGDELCIMTVTGELFAEYQLWLEDSSPFGNTFFFIHTNGITGYVATKEDYELGPAGGYESWGFPVYRPPWLQPDPSVERRTKEGITDLLNELKSE